MSRPLLEFGGGLGEILCDLFHLRSVSEAEPLISGAEGRDHLRHTSMSLQAPEPLGRFERLGFRLSAIDPDPGGRDRVAAGRRGRGRPGRPRRFTRRGRLSDSGSEHAACRGVLRSRVNLRAAGFWPGAPPARDSSETAGTIILRMAGNILQ